MSEHPLRIARCLRNLTIQQLADEARIGASTVWRAEHSRPINAESRQRLCLYFHRTSQELGLVGGGKQEQPLKTLVATAVEPAEDLSYEEQAGMRLALKGNGLASLFDVGLSLDEVMSSLRIVLSGSQGMPPFLRDKLIQRQDGTLFSEKQVTWEDRRRLHSALNESVASGWRQFHTSRPVQVLVTTQAQLYLVRQTQDLLTLEERCGLYAALYNLSGAAYLYQQRYDVARRAYRQAHQAALEGLDIWDQAQSLNWQAIVANARDLYMEAVRAIESALELVKDEQDERFIRLRAHLLADRAYNASLLQEERLVSESLASSAALLEHLGPDEEFDRARWHQISGSSLLNLGKYSGAVQHLHQSLALLPAPWVARQILTLLPLAEAYAHLRERDASLEIASKIISILGQADSSMLNQRFLEYQQLLLEIYPSDKLVRAFLARR